MPEFTIDGKKLKVAEDVDGEIWLRGRDVAEILKSTKRESEELQEWISDKVIPNVKSSNENVSLYTTDLCLDLRKEIEKKNEEIILNQKTISKLRQSLAELQKQLSQIEPKFTGTETLSNENGYLFFLIKKNLEKIESGMDNFPYYVLRAKKRFAKESMDHLKSKFPFSEVLLRVEDPPEVDLFNRITELKDIKSCENHVETRLSEDEMISLFENLKFSKGY